MRKALVCAVSIAIVGVAASTATGRTAEERQCRGTIGAETVDNLRVPDGASCTLNGTRVKGTIYVGTGSTLVANSVRVIGNVQAEGSRNVVVRRGSHVGGSIQIVQGGSAAVRRTAVGGDLLFDENRRQLRAVANTIEGNLQAFQNSGGVEILRNRIDGNLQCKGNNPPPTGGGNIVQGNKEDQCANL